LNSRERVLLTLEHKEPDRVPIDLGGNQTGITKIAYDGLKRYLGISGESEIYDPMQQLAMPDETFLDMFDIDTRYVFPGKPQGWDLQIKEDEKGYSYTDEWGITLRMPKENGYYYDMVGHPLVDFEVEDIDRYDWPDPRDPGRTEGLKEKARDLSERTDYALVTGIGGSMFELSWYLRGFERFFTDLIVNKRFSEKLLDRLLAFWLDFFEDFLDSVGKYVHVVTLGDDLGGQESPLVAPDLYREILRPRQKELFQFIKSKTEARILYHSCGSVRSFIADLIEIGVDILNPLQVSAKDMDTKELKREFGDKILFWGGGCDTQRILPFGSPQEVRVEVKKRIGDLAPGGGFVFNQVHNIQPDTPAENIVAMLRAAKEYGKYSHDL
jgi:uroporphyrinogen decarboxylase